MKDFFKTPGAMSSTNDENIKIPPFFSKQNANLTVTELQPKDLRDPIWNKAPSPPP